jgi:flavodoxin-like protein
MRAVVIYESIYGNTHAIADAIGRGLGPEFDVAVVPVAEASTKLLADADLVVAGGPTHDHGMSAARTRQAAAQAARRDGSGLSLEPHAGGAGLRDWFIVAGRLHGWGVAFDTLADDPAMFTKRASKTIAKLLEHHGLTEITHARSFLVGKDNHLLPGEEDRAEKLGRELAAGLPPAARAAA